MGKVERVLVAQPEPVQTNSVWDRLVEKTGVQLHFQPFIRVEGVSAYEFRKQKVAYSKFPCVILTSRAAIDHFFRLAEEIRYAVPETVRYFCTTEQAALYLQKYIIYRKRRIFFAEDGRMETLMSHMEKYKAERFLLPVPENFKPELPRQLRKFGLRVTRSIMFRTVSEELPSIQLGDYDLLVFYSPYDVQSLKENFPEYTQGNQRIALWGKMTQNAATGAGLTPVISLPQPECRSMTDALERYIMQANQ